MVDAKWVKTPNDEKAVEAGCWFDEDAGRRPVQFFEKFLRHAEGRWTGKPFTLEPWERDEIIMPLFGWKRKDGTRRFRSGDIWVSKKNGKALALDTPIPTPTGWTVMGNLREGSEVFAPNGMVVRVVRNSMVMYGRPCYCVRFSDGSSIVADAEHQWKTRTRKPGRAERLWTTEQIAECIYLDYKGSEGFNHSITVADAIQTGDAKLPLDPYVLGVWLGDGDSGSASFTCADEPIIKNLRQHGVEARKRQTRYRYGLDFVGHRRGCAGSLQSLLRSMGLLGNKHIPPYYLRASPPQRLSLLRGLMDTDGYASKAGQCEFTTVSCELRNGVMELLRTLGYKPLLTNARAMLNGRDCGPKFRIQFWSFRGSGVFGLPRKANRLKAHTGKRARSRTRHIIAVEPVDSVPVMCIEIESRDGMFLAGEGFIPTHNSTLAAAIGLYLLVADDEKGAQVYAAANDRAQAGIVFDTALAMVRASPELRSRLECVPSRKRIVAGEKSWFEALSAEYATHEGLNASAVIVDEIHSFNSRGAALFSTLYHSGAAREQPLRIVISTAGDDDTGIGRKQYDFAKGILDGSIDDWTSFAFVAEAPMDMDWTSEEAWKIANPNYGVTIKAEEMASECKKAQTSPRLQADFRRYRLNQWVHTATPWLDRLEWDACGIELSAETLRGRRCFGGLDLSATTDLTAFVLAFPDGEGDERTYTLLPWFWLPKEGIRDKEFRDRVPYRQWSEEGHIILTPGNVVDYGNVRETIKRAAGEYDIQEVAFDPYNATAIVQYLKDNDGLNMVECRQGFLTMSPACKTFERAMLSRRLQHSRHPILDWNASVIVTKADPAGNIKPDKEKSRHRIDGVVASVMAVYAASLGQSVTAEPVVCFVGDD